MTSLKREELDVNIKGPMGVLLQPITAPVAVSSLTLKTLGWFHRDYFKLDSTLTGFIVTLL